MDKDKSKTTIPIDIKSELVKLKIPFVERDLEMAFNSVTREKDWIAKHRQWEIIVLTTLSALILDNKIQNEWFTIVPILLAILFLGLEINIRWTIVETGKKTNIQERLLEERDYTIFQNNIIEWQFGTGPSRIREKGWNKVLSRIKNLHQPSLFLWHLPFLVLTLIQMLWKLKIF